MSTLKGFWQFLNTDVRELPWGEVAEKGIEAVTATKDFGESWQEQAPKIEQLKPYWSQVEPFLKVLDAPVTQLAIAGLPFASIGIGLLRIYLDKSKIEPTYEGAVTLTAQLAFLQSLEAVLNNLSKETVQESLQRVSLQRLIEKQLNQLGDSEISSAEAKTVTNRFRESVLAKTFSEVLTAQFLEAGIDAADTKRLTEQVVWGTHRYLHQAIVEAGDSVEPLAEVYRTGGQEVQDRYDHIDAYLTEKIAPLPDEQVFDEADPKIRFRDIYVPLQVQPLTQEGEVKSNTAPINIHTWALRLLEQPPEPRRVMFVEGEAGRGKSVFCRIFADTVRQELEFAYIPLLIRLRNIRVLANNLTETLEDCPDLEQVPFVRGEADWLADPNTRFLIILDGFDELLLEGRATGGLKEFLQQVADFQARSHHQCIVTGRPLALQGVDRLITQTKGLARVRLEPMSNELREQWLAKWQKIFRIAEVDKFRAFLVACPNEISDNLAREPLLLYLLARMHREEHLTREMFAEVAGEANQRIQAKLRVYRESVNWVLEKQRQDENLRLAGLEELDDLREVLQEVALCVVQSGNETARLTMVKNRFQDTANPVTKFLKEAKDTTGQSEDKALNNLLTTFYLKPGAGDKRGSVEFAHKSFGEYLFAERLIVAFEAWTELDRRKRPRMDEGTVNGQIYDLLGYGGLSIEIVEYVFELLAESEIDRVQLFHRLHEFYQRWCEGEFLDQPPNENLPQKKMLQLRDQAITTGLKKVDVFTGLNVLIVLFKLHAAAQTESYPQPQENDPEPDINFHPCGQPGTDSFDEFQLPNLIHYADTLGVSTFARYVGPHLNSANLSKANLNSANLFRANLSRANLSRADLNSAYLNRANLDSANLYRANLSKADLNSANLYSANLYSANLSSACLFRANLSKAYLYSANLSSAELYIANLSSADLNNADLNNADLYSTDLTSADLYSANLNRAYLDRAYLYRANLSHADLDSANFDDAILLETDLRHASDLKQAQLTSEPLPLICGALLPPDLECDPDRDWDRLLPDVLHERYPDAFKTVEAARNFVRSRREPED